jgi:hypothetical protein
MSEETSFARSTHSSFPHPLQCVIRTIRTPQRMLDDVA